MAGIGINRAQKLAHLRGIEDRRVMFDLRNDQRASQYRTGIALAAPSRDGIAENAPCKGSTTARRRSEEHTSELQSLMRITTAVLCLKKNKRTNTNKNTQ